MKNSGCTPGKYDECTLPSTREVQEMRQAYLAVRREVQSQRLKKPGDDVNLSSHTKYEKRK